MPGRKDLKRILVLGSGPIKIGQACEFDYSGTQACKALMEEGYEVVLVNSNPATIMTDPETATRTYIEPLTVEHLERIIEKERPEAILPTVGGQTALNLAVSLAESGVLDSYDVELIGASIESIQLAEDRERFRTTMIEIELPVPRSVIIRSEVELERALADNPDTIPLPAIVRSAFTLGGTGSSIAEDIDSLRAACVLGLRSSPVSEVLVEESVRGWKEIELEVVRDKADNFIVVCGIENFDPMGVHTGDSITVAPIQTLSDREYQALRNAAAKIIRSIGIDCGGANIQFAINPDTGEFVVIEMNPRVSRSSALASKATGYPIARVAAKLSVGLTLDEITNDITGLSACFEPSIDYVVTKIPRFGFDKFYGSEQRLGTQMHSVGEVMAIGSTFKDSFQKALRGLELDLSGFCQVSARRMLLNEMSPEELINSLAEPTRHRATDIFCAFSLGMTVDEIHHASQIDIWFLENLYELWLASNDALELLRNYLNSDNTGSKPICDFSKDDLLTSLREKCDSRSLIEKLKSLGFGDRQISELANNVAGNSILDENDIYELRKSIGLLPDYRSIDTCAGEFPTLRRYLYSSYASASASDSLDRFQELEPTSAPSVVILGGGPNRIGQGIEFDYCCVRASMALRERGLRTIMINCNPETVSTDYDVSDTLYFEPLTLEHVSDIIDFENPLGVIVQFGGQTPLNLAEALKARGVDILGTAPSSISMSEDRGKFKLFLESLGIRQPKAFLADTKESALVAAEEVGYPVIVRPSFVLGGRSMHIARTREAFESVLDSIVKGASGSLAASGNKLSLLIDEYLDDAIELDVDAVSDGKTTIIAGILRHVESAGVHSGDSSCIIPPLGISEEVRAKIEQWTAEIARSLVVKGLLNIQFALSGDDLYVLEVNPRASRTVPFVSKATGVPWVTLAARVIMGEKLSTIYDDDMEKHRQDSFNRVAVKGPLIPFDRFEKGLVCLGPEMRSTGEVMGIGNSRAVAFGKAQSAVHGSIVCRELSGGARMLLHAEPEFFEKALILIDKLQSAMIGLHATSGLYRYASGRGRRLGLFEPFPSPDSLDTGKAIPRLKELQLTRLCAIAPLDSDSHYLAMLRRAAIASNIPLTMTFEEIEELANAAGQLNGKRSLFDVECLQEIRSKINSPESLPSPSTFVRQALDSSLDNNGTGKVSVSTLSAWVE